MSRGKGREGLTEAPAFHPPPPSGRKSAEGAQRRKPAPDATRKLG